ncbi:MAG TPA: hypothetical protein DD381_08240 [Lentisphaeria bacterium]|nr:MAG: hypothetical protein A2X47_04800 [Lentisphaerae bacterium GWF2_38_69]HBM16311.1 hypothetical protein [Lentisphaeria bacterium]
MKTLAFRLMPGDDLKNSIIDIVRKESITAGFILSCAGSLSFARIRTANESVIKEYDRKFEIISLSGTLGTEGMHLHIALADENADMKGGHLLEGCRIYTTAELIIGLVDGKVFHRKYDAQTGFKELVIRN